MDAEILAANLLRLKGVDPDLPECDRVISVRDSHNVQIGTLTVLDLDDSGDDEIIEKLTRWRNANRECFFTQFEATPERTRKWIISSALPATNRILFLVRDAAGSPIGNIGLCNITAISAELDNVLRGEPLAIRGFMAHATSALLRWTRHQLGIRRINLHVFSDNERAIKLYEAVGFSRGESQGITRTLVSGEVHIAPSGLPAEPGEVALLEMKLTSAD